MADPLAISTAQGRGEAQVLPQSGKSPYDLYSDYIGAKKQKEAATIKKSADAYKGLDDLKLGGFVKDTQYLYDMKGQLQSRIASQLQANKGKYNTSTDEELVKNINKLKEMNQFSENTKQLFAAELTKLQAGKDQWDPETVKSVEIFYNMPIEERYKYINDGGKIPTLSPKKEVVNYIDEISKFKIPYKKIAGETGSKDGRIGTYETQEVDEAQLINQADRYWLAGQNNASKGAVKLFEVAQEKVDSDPNTVLLSDEERALKIKNEFVEEYKKIKLGEASTLKRYGSKSDTDGGFSFGDDNQIETDNYVYVVGDEEAITVGEPFEKATQKQKYTKKIVTPTPKKGGKNKMDEFTDANGKRIVFSPEKAVTNEKGEWIIMGTTGGESPKQKEVPYEGNEGVWRGNFDGSPSQIYDETAKRRSGKSTGKGGAAGASGISPKEEKTASLIDARKANPGVSDSELIKRYAKLGYKIK